MKTSNGIAKKEDDLVSETPTPIDQSTSKGQATRLKLYEMRLARQSIEECPWMLAGKVANHYLKLAKSAESLLRMSELVQHNDFKETENSRQFEALLLDLIAQEFCADFGEEPSWWKALANLKRFHKDMSVHEANETL